MTVRYSTRPPRPFEGFPLFPHNNRQWCRKIRGKIHSFGPWDDPTAALERHNREYPYLKAGVPVPDSFDGLTVKALCDSFMDAKKAEATAGQITQRWVDNLHEACLVLVASIDKRRFVESLGPDDFAKLRLAIVGKHTPMISRNFIIRIRSVFKWGYSNGKIDKPVRFGDSFKLPSKALVRKHRAEKGKMIWAASDAWRMVESANPPMRAMLLLGLNCGVNNADLCSLPMRCVAGGVFTFARTKTGIERTVPLWAETKRAIADYVKVRPEPLNKSDAGLLFITRWGNRWRSDSVTQELYKLLTALGIESGSFGWCRKTFQTIAERCGDIVAVRAVMGHADESMSDPYRQEIETARIERATGAVRDWLLAGKPKQSRNRKGGAK